MWVTNCRNFSGESSNIKKRFSSIERPLFLLVLSNSEIAEIIGISGAGSIAKYIQHTPAADAEIVCCGKLKTIGVISDAPSGAATPAVLTRAGLNLSQCARLLINSGLKIVPGVPYYDLRATYGCDIRFRPGVPEAVTIRNVSKNFALSCDCDLAVIGETIPGGTTTALCVLRALGYNVNVSSSLASNPMTLKEEVVRMAMQAASISPGSLRGDPMRAIRLFGDPMMPCVVGLTEGFLQAGKQVILAGGTQMGAVAAVLKGLDLTDFSHDLVIATTKYVFVDTSAGFIDLVEALEIDAFSAYPDFSRSRAIALRKYENGEVKEGVGAGGAMTLTCIAGFDQYEYRKEAEAVIKQL